MFNVNGFRAALLASSAMVVAYANPALAQSRDFDVPAQSAASGIAIFAQQADVQILVMEADTRGKQTRAVFGAMPTTSALELLLAGSGLKVIADDGRTLTLAAQDPQSASAAGDGADGTVEALIVTAQKREEDIQDVPIAISAFTQEDLTRSQVAGGPDLMTQVPNFTFTKTNFTGYSIQIRGIGTKAVSATTDAAERSRLITRPSSATASSSRNSTTWNGWRCCAARKARSTAATPRRAWSTSFPPNRAFNMRPSSLAT